jgi:hypothetical protein
LLKNTIYLIAILAIAAAASADAKPKHAHRSNQNATLIVCDDRGCSDHAAPAPAETSRVARAQSHDYDIDANGNSVIVGSRPSGCPYRFCGCEASLYLFGEIRPYLNLAANWIRKVPRTPPAPGMAAARSGHVMVLMSHIEGSDWLVHDGNSGGGRTREHVVSIRGYVIVDPRGSRSASN